MSITLQHSLDDEKKDAFSAEVQPVTDLESGSADDGKMIYDNIPAGVDPDLVREEKVIRGLKQRHIQVSPLTSIGDVADR